MYGHVFHLGLLHGRFCGGDLWLFGEGVVGVWDFVRMRRLPRLGG